MGKFSLLPPGSWWSLHIALPHSSFRFTRGSGKKGWFRTSYMIRGHKATAQVKWDRFATLCQDLSSGHSVPINSQQCGKHKLASAFFEFYMNLPSFLMSLINIEVFQLNATIYMQDPALISLQTRSRPPGYVGQSPSVRIDRPNDHASPAHAAYKV